MPRMKPDQLSPAMSERRVAGIVATVLAHTAMIVSWQATRPAPLPNGVEPPSFVWVQLPERVPVPRYPSTDQQPRTPLGHGAGGGVGSTTRHPRSERTARSLAHSDEPDASNADPSTANGVDAAPPDRDPAAPLHPTLEKAKRDVGAIDRATQGKSGLHRCAIGQPTDSDAQENRGSRRAGTKALLGSAQNRRGGQ